MSAFYYPKDRLLMLLIDSSNVYGLLKGHHLAGGLRQTTSIFIDQSESQRCRLTRDSRLKDRVECPRVELINHRQDVINRLVLVFQRNVVPNFKVYVKLVPHEVAKWLHGLGLLTSKFLFVLIFRVGALLVANLIVCQNGVDLVAHVADEGWVVNRAHSFCHYLIQLEGLHVNRLNLTVPLFSKSHSQSSGRQRQLILVKSLDDATIQRDCIVSVV